MTLPDLLLALAIGSLLLVVLASVTVYSSRSFYSFNQYSDMNARTVLAMDRMSREIRGCRGVVSASSTELVLSRGSNQTSLQFTYDPVARTLSRTADDQRTILLTECNSFQFALYRRYPVAGTFEQLPATAPGQARVVSLNWTCSRQVPGQPTATDQSQTARILLRQF